MFIGFGVGAAPSRGVMAAPRSAYTYKTAAVFRVGFKYGSASGIKKPPSSQAKFVYSGPSFAAALQAARAEVASGRWTQPGMEVAVWGGPSHMPLDKPWWRLFCEAKLMSWGWSWDGSCTTVPAPLPLTGFGGLDAQQPRTDPLQEAQRQLLLQAIAPLGQQMESIGLQYQESRGEYILMTSKFYDSSCTKKLVIGAVGGVVAGVVAGYFLGRL